MKCKSFVKFVPARRPGSGKPYQKAVKIYPRYYIKLGRFTPEPDMVECDGEVKVRIEAGQEGECACSSYPVLRLEYRCEKCGNENFYELPQTADEISKMITWFFSVMGEEARDEMIQEKVDGEKELFKKSEDARIIGEKVYEEWKANRYKRKKKR